MKNPVLIIMAAGIGSRYGGLKQIDPVGPSGEIIIDYSIYDALKAGFKDIVFIIRRDIEKSFREKVGKNIEGRASVKYVFQALTDIPGGFIPPKERTKPWGTGQAVLCAREAVDANFAVINADDFYGASAFKILYDYLAAAEDCHYCLVGYLLEKTLSEHGYVSRGVCSVSKDNYIIEINERKKIQRFGDTIKYTEDGQNWIDIPDKSIASMNMWGFTPGLFEELRRGFEGFLRKSLNSEKEEYLIPTAIGRLIKENKANVRMLPTGEKWYGITYPEDMAGVRGAIKDMVSKGMYPQRLWGK